MHTINQKKPSTTKLNCVIYNNEEKQERIGSLVPRVPWVPEVFLACGGNLRCWPKAEATSGDAARKDLTETGNRARKVSGTQGIPREKL